MKKLITLLFGFILSVFLTSTSQSQTGFIGSISTGISIPTGDLSNGFNAGFNLNGNGGYIFNKNIGARGDLSFNSFSTSLSGASGGTLHIVSIKGDVLVGNFTSTPLIPYGLAGMGLYSITRSDMQYGGITYIFTGETDFGMAFGGGAAYKVSHNISIFGEAQYNVIFTSGSSTTYIPFRVGAMMTP